MSLSYVNPGGQQARKATALTINIGAARGLQEVLKTNLGPKGTMKMLVSGAGLIKITKDGNTLLGEMQIQHPTASLIARTATATDDTTGDGSTSTVLVIGELLRQCERWIQDGLHPRILTEGFHIAKQEALKYLESCKVPIPADSKLEYLTNVARTALATKVGANFKDQLAQAVVDSVTAIIPEDGSPVDLHMVEVMHMRHRLSTDTRCINGIVLDHGGRNDGMPKHLENAYILTCNVSLEYEKSELTAGFYYKDPSKKAEMAAAERKSTDERCRQIIELKNQVCTKENGRTFVVINQKGIDPIALEMLSREGILALRRAKRRNMERLVLACGGEAVNSTENMTPEILGQARTVTEEQIGDDKYTYVESTSKVAKSVTLLIKGPDEHTINQIKDAVRDGLRAVKNAHEDSCVIAGAGALEVACHAHLLKFAESVNGKQKIGVRAFAEGLLVIPKTLAENSGLDVQEALITLQEANAEARKDGKWAGMNLADGKVIDPIAAGIFDNFAVKKSLLESCGVIAAQLLLVDEIMKAGRRGAGGN